jgi:hypothetical protein
MQAMLATLVGHFELTPGPELQEQLAAAAAAAAAPAGLAAEDDGDAGVLGPGLNPVAVLNEMSVHHVTLQSKNGIELQFVPRR